jgi:hypothetical protein
MIARLASAAIGLWLMAAPAVLDYGDPAASVDRIAGPVVASVAAIALSDVARGLRWAVLPVALVLFIAALLPGYDGDARVNSAACAAVLAALAPLGGKTKAKLGGGWPALR